MSTPWPLRMPTTTRFALPSHSHHSTRPHFAHPSSTHCHGCHHLQDNEIIIGNTSGQLAVFKGWPPCCARFDTALATHPPPTIRPVLLAVARVQQPRLGACVPARHCKTHTPQSLQLPHPRLTTNRRHPHPDLLHFSRRCPQRRTRASLQPPFFPLPASSSSPHPQLFQSTRTAL